MNSLIALINQISSSWTSQPDNLNLLMSLNERQMIAVERLLKAEISGDSAAELRDQFIDDFYYFDYYTNSIVSSILEAKCESRTIANNLRQGLFTRDADRELNELQALLKSGYVVSGLKLQPEILAKIYAAIAEIGFANRGIFEHELLGSEILEKIQDGSISKITRINGDTYWAKDLNQLAQKEVFRKLAFDPYILSMAAKYLGCVPIHDQTNIWFSFPTFKEGLNLSTNAQMFHQDKGFVKFLKVFIYLNDVTTANGPHVFVEGSHIDEAHKHGVPISDRISDEKIIHYYASDSVKVLEGGAGTMLFVDTSGVHKGMPIQAGHRVILQFEYTSSLYLSPVEPFSEINQPVPELMTYPENVRNRVTSNYSNTNREAYLDRMMREVRNSPNWLRKSLRLAKRYLNKL